MLSMPRSAFRTFFRTFSAKAPCRRPLFPFMRLLWHEERSARRIEWLEPLLDAIGDNAEFLAKRDDNGFMNKLSLAVPGAAKPKPAAKKAEADPSAEDRAQPKGQSHIRQARPQAPVAKVPQTGPMAAMLKRLFGSKD